MARLFKHELYKMLHSRGLRILVIVIAALSAISVLMFAALMDLSQEYNIIAGDITYEYISNNMLLNDMSNTLLYIAILSSAFIVYEFTTGTIKLTAMADFSRFQVYITKFAVLVLASFIVVTVQKLILVAGLHLAFGSQLESPVGMLWPFVIMPFLLELLMAASLCGLICFFAFLFRNTAALIIVSLALGIIIPLFSMYASFNDTALLNFFSNITYNLALPTYLTQRSTTNLVYYFISVLLHFAPFFVGGYFIFRNQELK